MSLPSKIVSCIKSSSEKPMRFCGRRTSRSNSSMLRKFFGLAMAVSLSAAWRLRLHGAGARQEDDGGDGFSPPRAPEHFAEHALGRRCGRGVDQKRVSELFSH